MTKLLARHASGPDSTTLPETGECYQFMEGEDESRGTPGESGYVGGFPGSVNLSTANDLFRTPTPGTQVTASSR
jgi:hypothetical protein